MLKADIYQQSALRTRYTRDLAGEDASVVFASAFDSFATATVLSQIFKRECCGTSASIIFPFLEHYSAESSYEMGRIWRYEIELDS